MHRIDADGHIGNLFTEGNQALGQPATKVSDAWLNDLQEEVCHLIEAAGITLTKGVRTQLATAMQGGTLPMNGIKFPAAQVPSADPNTQDDFERGDWTGAIGGSGGQSGQTYAQRECRYHKIGDLVVATFKLVLTARGTITGAVEIQGLPFALAANKDTFCAVHFGAMGAAFVSLGAIFTSPTVLTLRGAKAAALSLGSLVEADLSDTTELVGAICYTAA